jgi:hypothetical protein
MTTEEKAKLKAILQILANTSYQALIQVKENAKADKEIIKDLEVHKNVLENLVEELFEE